MPPSDTTQEQLALPLASAAHTPTAVAGDPLLREQVRLLCGHALLSQLVALLNAGILVCVLWPVVGHTSLVAWLVCMVTLCARRLQQSRAFTRARPAAEQVRRWRDRF